MLAEVVINVKHSIYFNIVNTFRARSIGIRFINARNIHTKDKNENESGCATKSDESNVELSKTLLNKAAIQEKAKLGCNVHLKCTSTKTNQLWKTGLNLDWPEILRTYGCDPSKKKAEQIAAERALFMLKESNFMSADGNLLLTSSITSEDSEAKMQRLLGEKYLCTSGCLENSRGIIAKYEDNPSNCDHVVKLPSGITSEPDYDPSNLKISKAQLQKVVTQLKEKLGVNVHLKYTSTRSNDLWKTGLSLDWSEVLKKYGCNSAQGSEWITAERTLFKLKGQTILADGSFIKHISTEESELTRRQLQGCEKLAEWFPTPKSTLHNYYQSVSQKLGSSNYYVVPSFQKIKTENNEIKWNCVYQVKWPEEISFSAVMHNKYLAAKEAALRALYWLWTQKKITKRGVPIINERLKDSHINITVHSNFIEDIEMLLQSYKQDIEPLLKRSEDIQADQEDDIIQQEDITAGSAELLNPTTGFSVQNTSSGKLARESETLFGRYEDRIISEDNRLPITQFRSTLVELAENNQVIVVKGEPGCGKSTKVPQYLYEHWTRSLHAPECNIIITQPRRIAAISLAERVASERQENVGDVVGYQVRFKKAIPRFKSGSILFCTTGILLRRMQNNPGLVGLSHVILDEAHERDINTDVLMVLLRRALGLNPQLRVVVMSATIDAELFQQYFNNSPVIHISGFTHPVKSYFLEDIEAMGLSQRTTSFDNPNPSVDCLQVAKLVRWIDENRPPGAILCFMPGWNEIKRTWDLLNNGLSNYTHIVLPAHSRLTNDDQRQIFHVPPPGVRKIILATNIAESSITIDDVVYVVDTGAHKEERYDVERGISLDNHWVSQASVNQRKGRAGRLQPGESFHLYSSSKYKMLQEFSIPEIKRIPLQKTILDCKTYSPNEKAADFLAEMPEPPSSQAVNQAILDLIQLGALTADEKLTPLGKRIAPFSIHPKISKAMIHAAIFRCMSPVMTIATVSTGEVSIFNSNLETKAKVREAKKWFHPSSDHLALARLYQQWEGKKNMYRAEANNFCNEWCIRTESMAFVSKLRMLYNDYLHQCCILHDGESSLKPGANCNMYAESNQLVTAVFFSGIQNLLLRSKKANVLFTECGHRACIHPESINYKNEDSTSPLIAYFRHVQSLERRSVVVHDTSVLSPLTVLLFSSGQVNINKCNIDRSEKGSTDSHVLLEFKDWSNIIMLCEERHAELLLKLRIAMWRVVDYFVTVEGYIHHNEDYSTMRAFHEKLLQLLICLLHDDNAEIKNVKELFEER